MRALCLLLLAALPLSADTTFHVYTQKPYNMKEIDRSVAPLREAMPGASFSLTPLEEKDADILAAKRTAKAIEEGVEELPCLVIRDEHGAFAALPLTQLTREALSRAFEARQNNNREEISEVRRLHAHIYLLFASLGIEGAETPEIQRRRLEETRSLMAHPQATEQDRQRLGLLCLYPLLMKQYASMYKGAHTPETEAKLLEAIEAIETVRDTNPNSELGKKASQERERLRMARRRSRQYE